jgi:hypothetical protein
VGDNRISTTSQFPAPLQQLDATNWGLSLLTCMGMSLMVFLGAMWTARWMSKDSGRPAGARSLSCEEPMTVDWCVRRGDEALCFSRVAD